MKRFLKIMIPTSSDRILLGALIILKWRGNIILSNSKELNNIFRCFKCIWWHKEYYFCKKLNKFLSCLVDVNDEKVDKIFNNLINTVEISYQPIEYY